MTAATVITMTLVGLAIVALFVVLGPLASRTGMSAEVSRKLAHVGTGLIAASFAWLFDDTLPVVILSGFGLGLALLTRFWAPARTRLGHIVHRVSRRSFGDYCVPIVVPLLHALAMPDRLVYAIPILVLTLADAAAALVGTRFGRWTYRTDEGTKTVEGSLTLALVAGIVVVAPLLLDGVAPGRSIVIAIMVAILVMLAEAVSWKGLDNLVVPLGTFALLRIYLDLPLDELVPRVVVATIILVVAIAWHRRVGLMGAGRLAAALLVYASWALGGWAWLVPPVLVLAAIPFVGVREDLEDDGVGAVLSLGAAPLAFLFADGMMPATSLLVPFAASTCAALGVAGAVRWRFDRAEHQRDPWLPITLVATTLLIAASCTLIPDTPPSGTTMVVTTMTALTLALILTLFSPVERRSPRIEHRWIGRAVVAIFVSCLVAALVLTNMLVR